MEGLGIVLFYSGISLLFVGLIFFIVAIIITAIDKEPDPKDNITK
jgi:hypothetical protein